MTDNAHALTKALLDDTQDALTVERLNRKAVERQRNTLLAAAEAALTALREMYDAIETGETSAQDLYTNEKYWPLTKLREAIRVAKGE